MHNQWPPQPLPECLLSDLLTYPLLLLQQTVSLCFVHYCRSSLHTYYYGGHCFIVIHHCLLHEGTTGYMFAVGSPPPSPPMMWYIISMYNLECEKCICLGKEIFPHFLMLWKQTSHSFLFDHLFVDSDSLFIFCLYTYSI